MDFTVSKTTTVRVTLTDVEGEYLKDLISRVNRGSENYKGQAIRKEISKALVDFKDVDQWTFDSPPIAQPPVAPARRL